jgi:hypothetical protein
MGADGDPMAVLDSRAAQGARRRRPARGGRRRHAHHHQRQHQSRRLLMMAEKAWPASPRPAKAARVFAQEGLPRFVRQRQPAVVGLAQDLAVHRVEQRALVLEMPVQRRLLHAEPLGQQPGAELVHADLVEQREGRLEDHFVVQFHADVRARAWANGGCFTAWNLSLIIPYQ